MSGSRGLLVVVLRLGELKWLHLLRRHRLKLNLVEAQRLQQSRRGALQGLLVLPLPQLWSQQKPLECLLVRHHRSSRDSIDQIRGCLLRRRRRRLHRRPPLDFAVRPPQLGAVHWVKRFLTRFGLLNNRVSLDVPASSDDRSYVGKNSSKRTIRRCRRSRSHGLTNWGTKSGSRFASLWLIIWVFVLFAIYCSRQYSIFEGARAVVFVLEFAVQSQVGWPRIRVARFKRFRAKCPRFTFPQSLFCASVAVWLLLCQTVVSPFNAG